MISVRRAALIWTTVVLAVVGLVAFVIAYEMARHEAADFLDGQLRQIALNVGLQGGASPVPDDVRDPEDMFVVEVWQGQTRRFIHPTGLADIPLLAAPGLATVPVGDEEWRVCRVDRNGQVVQVSQRITVQAEMAENAAFQAGLPVLIAIPLAWLGMSWGLSRVFGRLLRVERAIAVRSAENPAPIPLADVPLEMLPLVQAMNALIARIRQAMERQRRFVSDAAHQLRTPLAALQIQISNLGAAVGPNQSLSEMEGGVRRAARLVDQLLHMARLEGDRNSQPAALPIMVDLTGLVTQCVADAIPVAEEKGVDLGLTMADPVTIRGVDAELAMLFGNLIENAVRYTPPGGHVDVAVSCRDDQAMIEISDTGRGIPEAALPHVFERFFRAVDDDNQGTGLGLAIVAAVAERHGLRVDLVNRPEGGLRARVMLDHLTLP